MKCSLALCLCAFLSLAAGKKPRHHDTLIRAIHQVESSGQMNPPDGDGGASIGPLQIQEAYWKDATDFDKSIGGTYQDCRRLEYAERVVRAYWARYGGKNPTDEKLARIHNGGPRGDRKASTVEYWGKVRAEMGGGK